MRSFNTAGPCNPSDHYMLPPERRLGQVMQLIEERKFFAFHAGHQTGKTTCARWLRDHYRAGDRYACMWVDLQTAREEPDPQKAMRTVLEKLDHALRRDLPQAVPPAWEPGFNPATALVDYLRGLSAMVARPLVVLFDEVDGLVGPAMVSFLTQLRDGYLDRSESPFPQSVVLIGRRQVRDYVISMEERGPVSWLGTSSPFNITAEAATLGPFSRAEVAELLMQHTSETGQVFLPEAAARIDELSCGHPWLVNALADQIVRRDVPDRSVAITCAHVEMAKETIILERRSHIDSLVARLREPRVMRIIEPMLIGAEAVDDLLDDDLAYVMGLGLLVKRGGQVEIANPIYREVIPRALTYARQIQIRQEPAWYLRPDGGLDVPRLMAAWQEYWRKDGHVSLEGARSYREAGPHLLLMAFLQRIVNGGGRIEREYALGRGAMDLMIFWREERHAIEVKLRRGSETEIDALDQLGRYLAGAGLLEGWLVLFDLRKRRSWKEKLKIRKRRRDGRVLWIVGC